MILNKSCLSLMGLFLIIVFDSCGLKELHDSRDEIVNFIKEAQDKSIELFDGWNIVERNDGYVFNYKDKEHTLLIIDHEEMGLMFKEIFPKQDSTFYPLKEILKRSDNYPFKVNDFPDKVMLFKELKVNRVESISELKLIMFINDHFTIIYSQIGTDIRALSRFKEYTEYDNYWYYYLKD